MARWFLVLVSLFIFCPISVRAFSVSPLSYQTNIDPGKEGSVWVDITNNETEEQVFQIGVVGALQNNYGQPVFKNSIDIAEGWVIPEKKEVAVKPNNKERIIYEIQVPKNSPPGDHYLGLYVEPKVQSKNLGVKGRLVTLLSIQVSGVAKEKISIQNWGESSNLLFPGDLNFNLVILNDGNVSVPLKIYAVLFNSKNELVEKKELEAGASLMAGQNRKLNVGFSSNKLKPGNYQAEVRVDYGLTGQSEIQVKNFWYLSGSVKYYLLGILSVTFLFIGLLYFLKKKSYV